MPLRNEITLRKQADDAGTKKRLSNIRVGEISLVDNPAIQKEFAVIKRKVDDGQAPLTKKGAKMSATRLKKLNEAWEALGKLLDELKPEDDTGDDEEVTKMDEKMLAKIEELEKSLGELKTANEELTKRAETAEVAHTELVAKVEADAEARKTEDEEVKKNAETKAEADKALTEKLEDVEKRTKKTEEDAAATVASIAEVKKSIEEHGTAMDEVKKKVEELEAPAIGKTGGEAAGGEPVAKNDEASFSSILGLR